MNLQQGLIQRHLKDLPLNLSTSFWPIAEMNRIKGIRDIKRRIKGGREREKEVSEGRGRGRDRGRI